MEGGNLTLQPTDFVLREVIDQAVDLFRAEARTKGLAFTSNVTAEVPTQVSGDCTRLRQVLSNLLGNALKFTQKGEVILNVSPVAQSDAEVRLRFEVSDTGIGIEPQVQARLFEAFTQADGSNTRKYGGTGLGLAISKRIVELMNGQIGLASAPGQGSTFYFEVPLGKKAGPVVTTAPADLKGLHILLVSDNSSELQIMAGYVKAWSMRNDSAKNSDEAIQLLRKSVVDDPFEIALLDFHSSVNDSLSLARNIRREPLLNSVKLVLVAPRDRQPDPAVVKAAGISVVLARPVQEQQLSTQLVEVMAGILAQRTRQIALSGSLPKQYREIRQKKEIKILLAEDNKINQMVFLGVLQKLGYGADLANHGLEAVKAMSKAEYDVIFMDCQMPEMDGYEATRQIRAGKWHQPRIIAITANIMHGDDEKCRGAGMDDYMAKPVRIERLREMLDRWLPV
jgi:CheY-like chemotaxis protein